MTFIEKLQELEQQCNVLRDNDSPEVLDNLHYAISKYLEYAKYVQENLKNESELYSLENQSPEC
jgi:DNA-binding protein H-NS